VTSKRAHGILQSTHGGMVDVTDDI
jgi:hypothetical protein